MTRPRHEQGSLFKAIDGQHLRWNVFREDVLLPFNIHIGKPIEPSNLPQALLSRIQDRLQDLGRFDHQRQKWRDQLARGQGFSLPTIFPPNALPQLPSLSKMQRILTPKMSREALPRRSKSASLFELPSAKPLFASAFSTENFSESEQSAMPSSLSPSGIVLDFSTGYIGTGLILHCPFLVFERCQSSDADDVERGLNMCAISGAQCVRGLQDVSSRAHKRHSTDMFSFSCLLNDQVAIINIHTVDEQGKHVMSCLHKFDLVVDEHYNSFQAWIEAIEEWACGTLLSTLQDCLTKLSSTGDTPPASPIPSLALSIDTEVGNISALLFALRRGYPTVAWHGDAPGDSPINSSVANCGTPWEGRRSQSFAMASPAPGSHSNLMLRRNRGLSLVSPINTRGPQQSWIPARPSPFSPRYQPQSASMLSASLVYDTIAESPCRPPTLSPCTPPPDQPWKAKSPMLVLQKRVDIAMDEVQELRSQVELLQTELAAKNQLITERLTAMEGIQQLQQAVEDKLKAVEFKEQEMQQANKESAATPWWTNFVFAYEGWDSVIEQALFALALVGLFLVGMLALRSLILPVLAHLCFGVGLVASLLHTASRRVLDVRRLIKMPEGLHRLIPWQQPFAWRKIAT